MLRNIIGYCIGFLLFIVLVPYLMGLIANYDFFCFPQPAWISILAIAIIIIGFTFALWTVIYMKKVGKGHPADAFNHEIAKRTQNLMTSGPYSICRNPMLEGTIILYIGWALWLKSWLSLIPAIIFIAVLTLQVISEEKRLLKDFGQEYKNYCDKTPRFLLGKLLQNKK